MQNLRQLEKTVIQQLPVDGEQMSYEQLSEKIGKNKGTVAKIASWLREKQMVAISEEIDRKIRLGPEGLLFLSKGFPERRLVKAILDLGGRCSFKDAEARSGLSDKHMNVAILWGKRKNWIRIDRTNGQIILSANKEAEKGQDEMLVETLTDKVLDTEKLSPELRSGVDPLTKRPEVLEIVERRIRRLQLTEKGVEAAESLRREEAKVAELRREVTQLTPELISSGKWREVQLSRYDLRAPVAATWPGKKQPYLSFLDELKRKLVGLGFKEMTGPLVELMFFNCDCLFMPQDHPAREIHDIYYIKSPTEGDLGRYASFLPKVRKAHEDGWRTGSTGWGVKYSNKAAKRLILRSHGTSVSARTLMNETLEIPGKYFSITRCYRPDVIDREHLTEFNQVEGIVVGEGLTLRDLLGVLARFAVDIAEADEVRFKPDYFPFTEPSVELAAYKEGYGWVECGGSGIFRPEMMLPLGVDVPVIAWGLGVDRLYMLKARIDDIRTLFTHDLGYLRRKELR